MILIENFDLARKETFLRILDSFIKLKERKMYKSKSKSSSSSSSSGFILVE